MKLYKSLLAALMLGAMAIGTAQAALVIPSVLVGDAGNLADMKVWNDGINDGIIAIGAVNYEYRIGKYEVTLNQYTAFLNAVAATDTYSLYDTSMVTDGTIAGISRSGSNGSFSYSVIGSGNRPVTYVSWFDAARFANWMHNGATNEASTEMGAYALNGAMTGIIMKNAGATWWIPSEDEWYKAAYYKGGGNNAGYWIYPTQSDTIAGNTIGVAQSANYYDGNFAQVQNDLPSSLTDVGAYGANSASFYGTYDQGGNIWEWNDAVISGSGRGLRGGSWNPMSGSLLSSDRSGLDPTYDYNNLVGFRIASVPETSGVPEPRQVAASGFLLVGGGLYCLVRRRKVKTVA